MTHRARAIAPLQEEERQTVMRANLIRRDIEGTFVRADRVLLSARAAISDGDILQNLWIVRMVAEREAVRRQGRVEVPLSLERDGFAQIIDATRAEFTF